MVRFNGVFGGAPLGLLARFSDKERELLVALPYRAGLWLSRCDDTGGADSDEAEINALRSIIISFAEDFLKSEFVEEIMKETVSRRDCWPEWEKDTDGVPDECTKAVEMVAAQLEEKNTTAFKRNLIQIAMTVALAYRELDEGMALIEKMKIYLRYYRQRLLAAVKNQQILSLDEYLNISRAEHAALSQLSAALRMEYKEGLPPQAPATAAEG